ncbi:GNAT family N-acetyltransferase [Actinomyces sp. B33]|uniref:GNAT family N-acetyltransferase n=1 Tax=Actinomyces sp. B33 TaxID=2942131 RepID=UPI0023410872|nr:GNAT family N-acetyltransferase [Actinomyces sp. B33]MDC4232891.1 GNAT family N-acetyltransferase [Actinomyces sp. B33]
MEQRTLQAQLDALADAARPAGIEIATLTPYDIPTLAILTLEAYGEPVTAESVLEASEEIRLSFDGAFGPITEDSFIGAWDGGALVGAILVVRGSPWDEPTDDPVVMDLVVDPEYRRRGIATALVNEAASRCRDWGFDSLSLRLDSRHSGAHELYSVLGFDEIGA